jgi:hypothetical protein
MKTSTRSYTRRASGATRVDSVGRGAPSGGRNPLDLCGTWLFCDSFRAYNGGHSSSDISFTLHADGSYTYGSERSMSAYAYGQGMFTNGSDSDTGHWSIEDGFLLANSTTRGPQRFRLTKANHPMTGEPMLCLDGQCFVTQQARQPW